MTNTTIRERFGLDLKNSATASRLIKEAVTSGMVKPQDEDAAPKVRQYVPFLAHEQLLILLAGYLLEGLWGGCTAIAKLSRQGPNSL